MDSVIGTVRRYAAVFAVTALVLFGLTARAAAQSCYPQCPASDAALTGLATPNSIKLHHKKPATVSGILHGSAASVLTTLAFSKGAVTPPSATLSVGSGQAYSVLFSLKAQHRGGGTVTGCTIAQPVDSDPSNNCGSADIRVRRP